MKEIYGGLMGRVHIFGTHIYLSKEEMLDSGKENTFGGHWGIRAVVMNTVREMI
jgi:hypothetical protein